MESSGRRKLFEILNRAKEELEQQNEESSSVVSASSSSCRVNSTNSLPRGAGRGRLFRSELLERASTGTITNGVIPNTQYNEAISHTQCDEVIPSNQRNGAIRKYSRTSNANNESIANEELHRLEMKERKTGSKGNSVPLAVNYIPISCKPGTSIFEYDVRYEPNIHSNQIRRGLVASILKPIVPVYTFDGTSLYLPHQLSENVTNFTAKNRNDNDSEVRIIITFRREKSMKECIHFYNVLFKQIMLRLEFVQFGQKMFDPTEPKNIPHRKLTIWPGYVLACDEYDGGLMLILDTSHRILFDTKVSDILRRIRMSCQQNTEQNFKDLVMKSLLGAIILTPYNNRTYTIDDVDFEKSPRNKFNTANSEISYVEYYKTNHGVDIHDLDQPLLISYKDRKVLGRDGQIQRDRATICLIPELCQLTGLTDEMRNDNVVMRDIASYTRVTPNQRVEAARKYIARVNETHVTKEILDNWGLRLYDDILKLHGRQLPFEMIKFGNDKVIEGINGDFSSKIDKCVLFEVVDLNDWIVFYTHQDNRAKSEFLINVDRCASGMGLVWKKPIEHLLPNDRNDTYTHALRQHIQPNTQMVVFICPTSRDDRYATIKKICCSDNPVASQVINAKTLANKQKNRSIVQKILMQMNCKLGGSLWSIRIPFKKSVMICGMDTYHNPSKTERSVGAFVASLNNTYTKWYSKATIQSSHEELLHGLTISMGNALDAYRKHNGLLPDWIILYRDGVGDGQFKLCKEFEFNQIKAACRSFDAQYNPEITFIIVQKRGNARIFAVDDSRKHFENPMPGTVLDHSITRRGLFDFYLVSQKLRHGTVTPSHYVVIENETNLSADVLQQLSYKLTYQYFNWPGSIRVPAPCQYAHKLAYLVGESVKRETSKELSDKLFYL